MYSAFFRRINLVVISCAILSNQGDATDPVRLVNGNSYSGRVEIMHDGVWGTVTDDGFTITDAHVVCRQLGFRQATAARGYAYYGQGYGTIWMDNVACAGNEPSLDQCPSKGWGVHSDTHSEDVGVDCENVRVAPIAFTVNEVSAHEGQGSVYLTLHNTGMNDGTVSLYTVGGTATAGVDYASIDGLTVAVPAYGSTNVTIDVYDDSIAETTEYFTVDITAPNTELGNITSARVTLLDHYESPLAEPGIHGLTLICNGTNMTAIFNASSLPYTNASEVHLLDENCKASKYGENQAIASTGYYNCQTDILESEGHIFFRNSLILGPVEDHSPFDQPQIDIQCAFERRHTVGKSYLVNHKTHYTLFNNFSFGVDIFESNDFRYAYRPDDYPLLLKAYDYIYLAVMVFTVNTLDLFIDTCWATSSANPWDDSSYSLILHGCPDDATVAFYDSGIPTVEQFSFRVFKFKGESSVYIHCQVLVCDVNTANSRCSQGCIEREQGSPGRMRRSESDLHTVTAGPLIVEG